MNGYCNYFNCFIDSDELEKEQDEMGEHCLIDCQDCEWYED